MPNKNLKNTSTKTGASKPDRKNTLEYYNSILLEEIRGQMKTVIETVEVSQASNDQRFTDLEKKMDNRFEVVEAAIRHNSQDIKEVKTEMHQMENRLSDKIDRIGNRVDNHEVRITNLETARL